MHAIRSKAILVAVTVLTGMVSNASLADSLLGTWTLNPEKSITVSKKDRREVAVSGALIAADVVLFLRGFLKHAGKCPAHSSCQLVPLPKPIWSSTTPNPGPDPKVLQCLELTIEIVDEDIRLNYVGVGEERLTPGEVHGFRTTFKPRKLTTRYETTTREVKTTYSLTKEGQLYVTVKINPTEGKTLIHRRIFDRTI